MACCTHLDNQGGKARKQSVRLILETIERIRGQWTINCTPDHRLEDRSKGIGVFLAGDFNSLPEQEAYLEMKHSDLMCDLREHVKPEKRYGEEITFPGLHKDQDPEDHGRLDFMFRHSLDIVSFHEDSCLYRVNALDKTFIHSSYRMLAELALPVRQPEQCIFPFVRSSSPGSGDSANRCLGRKPSLCRGPHNE